MSSSNGFKLYLAVGMLVTGTLNTILTKMQNYVCVDNCDDPNPKNHLLYSQPVWQTLNMFIGEILCLVVFFAANIYTRFTSNVKRYEYQQIVDSTLNLNNAENPNYNTLNSSDNNSHSAELTDDQIEQQIQNLKAEKPELSGLNNLLLSIPAACDIITTTLLNVGLLFTTASVFQMLRGLVVIFVGLFSVKFLGHSLTRDQWVSLVMIVTGALIVGTSSILNSKGDSETSTIGHIANITLGNEVDRAENIFGIIVILFAQVFGALMMISEEKIMQHHSYQPLKGVGLEGTFGALTVGILIPILHYTVGVNNRGGYFDADAAFSQIMNNKSIFNFCIYIMLSISMLNYFGMSITKAISAASRSTIDSCRYHFIYIYLPTFPFSHIEAYRKWLHVAFIIPCITCILL
ncbi:Solute carrier family 35 member F6 [Smittium culicis]|uniref:Solute carrier family 35 member F6 n=1 Tax=Smittium culicis TaxID=133412 RepID=A0A1R1X2C6_9FUNG|nr:Solute carrier family 35 member F6 [Smittium culicis]